MTTLVPQIRSLGAAGDLASSWKGSALEARLDYVAGTANDLKRGESC
jgi:hypothetical protein